MTIACITYNQAQFIRQTLDGFLMQETDFDFEIVVNDDASNDGTVEILKEYQQRHPKIIKPIFHEENLFSQGIRGMLVRFVLPEARGKYIALCEGDDYWTDPQKLQTQVDFLEQNPDYSVCFHQVIVHYDNGERSDQIYPDVEDESWYTTEELLKINYIQTNSVMYRRRNYDDLARDVMPTDWYLHMYHASFGKIKFLKKTMSVYRKHAGGLWWDYDVDRDRIWRGHGVEHLAMWIEARSLFVGNPAYTEIVNARVSDMLITLAEIDAKYGDHLIEKATVRFPDTTLFLIEQAKTNRDLIASLRRDQTSSLPIRVLRRIRSRIIAARAVAR